MKPLTLATAVILAAGMQSAATAQSPAASPPQAKVVAYHAYPKAVELTRAGARAVLCPEVGGRVLEFSVGGKNAMWLDPAESKREPGRPQVSAGRIDFGPELTTPRHEKIWSGEWTAEITGDSSTRFTSQRDENSGVQLIRDFELTDTPKAPTSGRGSPNTPTSGRGGSGPRLLVKQTIVNIGTEPREYCHWGRSFSPGGGICLIPLAGKSRFPSKYALYEDGGLINVKATDPNIRERDGFLEILAPPRKPKLGFDSYAGWLAYLMPDGTLFIKRFATYPDRVYNEAAGLTISVWYPPGDRIELEPIGPRERLEPGKSASFTEEWSLASFPYPKEGERIDLAKLRAQVEATK